MKSSTDLFVIADVWLVYPWKRSVCRLCGFIMSYSPDFYTKTSSLSLINFRNVLVFFTVYPGTTRKYKLSRIR